MAHTNLIEFRHLLKQSLAAVSNNHQAAGLKYRFGYEFVKGDKAIAAKESKAPIKTYFKLEIYMIDFSNEKLVEKETEEGTTSVYEGSVRTNLFRYAMPSTVKVTKDKMEEEAIKAFFTYSVNGGLMVQMQMLKQRQAMNKFTEISGNEYYEIQTLTDVIKDGDR